jgi:phage/plasmid-like protein (TIGR03299 family)
MSHNINEDRVMVVGEPAWHGIGTVLQNPATALEAIQAAKLDYEVVKSETPSFIRTPEGVEVEMPGEFGVYRKDTNQGFKCVGNRYNIVQNVEAFDFFDSVVGEGQAIYHTAGALGRGEKIWILAKLPNDLVVKGVDVVEKYLTLVNTHDGSTCLQMFFSPVRVVCQNTLSAALSQKSENQIKIRHSGDVKSKVKAAQEALKIAVKYYGDFEQIVGALADRALTKEEVERYFNVILFDNAEGDIERKKLNKQRDELLNLFENGIGQKMPEIRHTAWAAYNAVTEYIDHHKTYKKEAEQPTKRLSEIWFGSGADLRAKAFSSIVSLAELN